MNDKERVRELIRSGNLEEMEAEVTPLKSEISFLQGQLSESILKKTAERDADWFCKASTALSIKKLVLRDLNVAIMDAYKKKREERRALQRRRERRQNEFFYAKLKEVMSAEDFAAFMDECEKNLESEGMKL